MIVGFASTPNFFTMLVAANAFSYLSLRCFIPNLSESLYG